jgi:hypothetical protein
MALVLLGSSGLPGYGTCVAWFYWTAWGWHLCRLVLLDCLGMGLVLLGSSGLPGDGTCVAWF